MQRIEQLIDSLGTAPCDQPGAAATHALYRELIDGVAPTPARHLVIGRAWILVRNETGAGLAFAPQWTPGSAPSALAPLDGLTLRDIATLCRRPEPLAAAIGIAAINAHYNRPDLLGETDDGLMPADREARGQTVVIGRFPGLDAKLPGAAVIERNPGPRDYPPAAAAILLPAADRVIITASTLVNHTLPGLLALAPRAEISLIGPGTPLAPSLFAHGIATLGGFVLDAPDDAATAVANGAGYGKLKQFGRRLTLAAAKRPDP